VLFATLVQPGAVADVRSPGSGGHVENSQAFMPDMGGSGKQPELPVAVSTGPEERTRTLSLIDFLADWTAPAILEALSCRHD